MIVECYNCRSRYRLNPSIMKGHQGAEVRCRKCGGTFIIQVPGSLSGTGSPAGVAGAAVRRDVPLSPTDPVRPSARPGIVPPERTHHRPLPAARNPSHREAVLPEVPTGDVLENVYSFSSYRNDPSKRVPAKGFDISGSIRPEPALARAELDPAEADFRPAEASPRKEAAESPPLVDRKMEWKEEGVVASASGFSRSAPGIVKGPATWAPGRPTFQESLAKPISRNLSHIVLVYLALLFIGGCGYLLLDLLSGYLSGGGK